MVVVVAIIMMVMIHAPRTPPPLSSSSRRTRMLAIHYAPPLANNQASPLHARVPDPVGVLLENPFSEPSSCVAGGSGPGLDA